MKYLVVLEEGSDSWGAYVPDLPACVAAGKSRNEALKLIREAIALHLGRLREDGESLPVSSSTSKMVEINAA